MSHVPSVLEFGPFRFDAEKRILWQGGQVAPVPPKALDLLAALLEQPGEVVTKKELLARVWPDTFVEEANLSVNVSLLRKALGAQPDNRPYIETVARRGYRFVGAVSTAHRSSRTLAVLPFRPITYSEDDVQLGLGLADALITRLGGTGGIVVRPTSAIQRYVGDDTEPREVGRALRVDAVLDGRLQREGSRLRVTAQLLPVDASAPLWAARFDEELSDLFAVQDAIAERLAQALALELGAEQKGRLMRRHTESVEAYQAYSRGRYFWSRFARPWMEKAALHFQEASALDPTYALPHSVSPTCSSRRVSREPSARAKPGSWRKPKRTVHGRSTGSSPRRTFRRPGYGSFATGIGEAPRRASGAPSSCRLIRRRLTSGSVSSWTCAVVSPKRRRRSPAPKSWILSRSSSRPSGASSTFSQATTRERSSSSGARSSWTRTSSSGTGRWESRSAARAGTRTPSPSTAAR